MRRKFKTFTLAGMVALAMAVTTALPAQAAPRLNSSTYVALGDSYSSGALLGGNLDQTCDRSSAAYPVVLAGGTNFVSFKACSGATTLDVIAALPTTPQPSVKTVTLTVGFNDTHWEEAVAALLASDPAAQTLLAATAAEIQTTVALRIPLLIASLQAAYPKATIFWGGYVRQFGSAEIAGPIPGVCAVGSGNPLSPTTVYLPNDLADTLDNLVNAMNGVIAANIAAARAAGAHITYVNADPQFTGKRACNNPNPAVFNLHPTVGGQLLYANAFMDAGAVK